MWADEGLKNSRKELVFQILLFALLVMALGSVVFGIANQVKELNFAPLFLVSLVALFFSWQLSRTRLSGWKPALFIFSVGLIFIFMSVGELWIPLLDWLVALAMTFWQWLTSSEKYPITVTQYWATGKELELRLTTVFLDINDWLRSIFAGNSASNYLAISFIWSLITWGISGWAGWFQRRWNKPLLAVLPAAILLAISLGYTYGSTTPLFPLIFSTLSLMSLNAYVRREQTWKQRNIDYPNDDVYENSMLILSIIVGFLVAAALIPRISFQILVDKVQQYTQPGAEQFEPILESFGLDQDLTSLGQIGSAMAGGLPRQHLIGSGPELSDQFVMAVHVMNDQILDEIQNLNLPLYWRAITYDHYTGFGWDSSEIVLENFEAEEISIPIETETHNLLQQENFLLEQNDLVFAAGEIVTVNTDYQMAWRIVPDMSKNEITSGDFFAASQAGLNYQVDSLFPIVSENTLRSVREQPPAWLSERYLEIPENVSQRVIDLSRRLTWNAPTSYDKARAIEAYLRSYEYELNLPAPPQNRELTDYFLFELQKGYCDYYATSMVVMARIAGIPARLVIGYTRGEYDLENQQFVVTEMNAHSWPELYFPGIGWIPFEPTASQEEITFPRSTRFANLQNQNPVLQERNSRQSNLNLNWQQWFWGIVLLPVMTIFLWLLLDRIYLGWLSPSKKVANLYRRLYRQAAQLGVHTRIGDTPHEFASKLEKQIQEVFSNTRWAGSIQPTQKDIQVFTDIYVRACFSPHPANSKETEETVKIWWRLRRRLFLARLAMLLTPLFSPAKILPSE